MDAPKMFGKSGLTDAQAAAEARSHEKGGAMTLGEIDALYGPIVPGKGISRKEAIARGWILGNGADGAVFIPTSTDRPRPMTRELEVASRLYAAMMPGLMARCEANGDIGEQRWFDGARAIARLEAQALIAEHDARQKERKDV